MRILNRISLLAVLLGLILWPNTASSAVRTTQVAVAATPTLIWTAPQGSGKVLVRNASATISVFVGNATVSTTTGFEITPGAALGIVLMNGATLFGVSASGTQTVQTIQGDNVS